MGQLTSPTLPEVVLPVSLAGLFLRIILQQTTQGLEQLLRSSHDANPPNYRTGIVSLLVSITALNTRPYKSCTMASFWTMKGHTRPHALIMLCIHTSPPFTSLHFTSAFRFSKRVGSCTAAWPVIICYTRRRANLVCRNILKLSPSRPISTLCSNPFFIPPPLPSLSLPFPSLSFAAKRVGLHWRLFYFRP